MPINQTMGIKYLNRYFLDNCRSSSIYKTQLVDLSNKTIVIDTSIYLYKYLIENSLIENMYLMISLFKKYNIKPIFVFDGKPPEEKRNLLIQRRMEKKEAFQKFICIKETLDTQELDDETRKQLLQNTELLKKQFIRVKEADTLKVKRLMDAYGVVYVTAEGESDSLCSHLVKTGIAWACLSDDMDMFVYGCSRVLRHFSLINHSVILYDTEKILLDIHLTENEFLDIMVLSGTDYNLNNETNLQQTLRWFKEYKKAFNKDGNSFYEWLCKNSKYIKNLDLLHTIKDIFMMIRYEVSANNIKDNYLTDTNINYPALRSLLREDGFLFCH